MRPSDTPRPRAVRAAEGAPVAALGMTHKIGCTDLGGRLLILEGVVPPGAIAHPHTHSREDECSFVIDGEVTYLIGDTTLHVGTGGYVAKPRGLRHAFWNASDKPARIMEIHTPATFDSYYDELGAVFESTQPDSEDFVTAFDGLANRYGLVVHWDQMPQMHARSGLGPRQP
jgi:uncharacterized cupin superfamily protein